MIFFSCVLYIYALSLGPSSAASAHYTVVLDPGVVVVFDIFMIWSCRSFGDLQYDSSQNSFLTFGPHISTNQASFDWVSGALNMTSTEVEFIRSAFSTLSHPTNNTCMYLSNSGILYNLYGGFSLSSDQLYKATWNFCVLFDLGPSSLTVSAQLRPSSRLTCHFRGPSH